MFQVPFTFLSRCTVWGCSRHRLYRWQNWFCIHSTPLEAGQFLIYTLLHTIICFQLSDLLNCKCVLHDSESLGYELVLNLAQTSLHSWTSLTQIRKHRLCLLTSCGRNAGWIGIRAFRRCHDIALMDNLRCGFYCLDHHDIHIPYFRIFRDHVVLRFPCPFFCQFVPALFDDTSVSGDVQAMRSPQHGFYEPKNAEIVVDCQTFRSCTYRYIPESLSLFWWYIFCLWVTQLYALSKLFLPPISVLSW